MTSLLLAVGTHDLDLTSGTIALVDGVDAIAQNLRCRLRTFLGEWFLDERIGVPYMQEILGQRRTIPRNAFVDSVFREVITSTKGVTGIDSFATSFDGASRELSITAVVIVDGDEVLTFEDAFVLTSTPGA